jgi:hypothetical protein
VLTGKAERSQESDNDYGFAWDGDVCWLRRVFISKATILSWLSADRKDADQKARNVPKIYTWTLRMSWWSGSSGRVPWEWTCEFSRWRWRSGHSTGHGSVCILSLSEQLS